MESDLRRFLLYLEVERGASVYTLRNYGGEIGEFVAFATERGVQSWPEVDDKLIRSWLASLHRADYHPASIARRLYELRSCFRFLQREQVVEENPAARVHVPKQPRTLPEYLSIEQVFELLAAPNTADPQGMRDLAILEVMYSGGLRRGEVLAMRIEDVNLTDGELRVHGKGNKERIALLGGPARQALRQYIEVARPQLLAHSGPLLQRPLQRPLRRPPTALFLNQSGQPISSPMTITNILNKYLDMVDLPRRVTPHTLRHSFATHLLEGGADLRSVQELLGHENVQTTTLYTQVRMSHLRSVVGRAHPHAGGRAQTPAADVDADAAADEVVAFNTG